VIRVGKKVLPVAFLNKNGSLNKSFCNEGREVLHISNIRSIAGT